MSVTLSQTENDVFTAVQTFLASCLPPGTPIFKGQGNRVPEPTQADYVECTPQFRTRLATDIETYADCTMIGSIAGTILTVGTITFGGFGIGAPVYGSAVALGTAVVAPGTAADTWIVSPAQTVPSGPLAAGTRQIRQEIEATIQLDVHGPNSANNATIIGTLWRNQFAVDSFAASGIDGAPLYHSAPRQLAFDNGEMQYEERWVIDLVMQINPVVGVGQQFADQLKARAYSQADIPA
jgi:hypothetical protein